MVIHRRPSNKLLKNRGFHVDYVGHAQLGRILLAFRSVSERISATERTRFVVTRESKLIGPTERIVEDRATMGYVVPDKPDIFLSYAWADNAELPDGSPGWVGEFARWLLNGLGRTSAEPTPATYGWTCNCRPMRD